MPHMAASCGSRRRGATTKMRVVSEDLVDWEPLLIRFIPKGRFDNPSMVVASSSLGSKKTQQSSNPTATFGFGK